jgi:hypothetical protein
MNKSGQTCGQGTLTGDVPAGGTFGVGTPHEHVFDAGGIDACTRHGVSNGMTAQGGPMGHVESTFPAFGQGGARGRNDDGLAHDGFLCNEGFIWCC